MRQTNQNKRLRSRNRKGPNPLTKSFESNGPDGKIRGTALSIAEKYIQASRDAAAAGDRVKAENLLQHAEHYNRIVAAAQAQLQPQQREQENRNEPDTSEDDTTAIAAAQVVAEPDSPQPTVDHSAQLANGLANGKIPNGVKLDSDTATDTEAGQAEAAQTQEADGEAEAPKRRPRGRPRTNRRPIQPSAIVAEVVNKEADGSQSTGSDGAD